MTILSIDDDQTYQETLVKLITKLSEGLVKVYTAFTLQSGLQIAAEKRPAVVLLDLILPDSPDYRETVTKELPKFVALGLPVIVTTGVADGTELPMKAYAAGAKRYYSKPQLTKLIPWLGEHPAESWAARLLGDASVIYLREKLKDTNGNGN